MCSFLADPFTWGLLQERFRRNTSDGIISDIYDGKEYKKHGEFLNQASHVSFALNTDGVALFRSSKVDIWPVWMVINELPRNKRYSELSPCCSKCLLCMYNILPRFQKRYMLLAALWYSADDPYMNTFLRPVIDDINKKVNTHNIGMWWCILNIIAKFPGSTPNGKMTARAILLLSSMDFQHEPMHYV